MERRHSDMLEDVLRQIGQHERFVLTSHARPDGDAVGSALACCQVLRAMGKQADVVLHDGVPRIYRSLPFADQVVQSNRVIGSYEAAIILECDSIHRTRLEGLEDRFLISIDHHVSGRPFAHVNWIDPHAVATAEMVFRLAREAGVKFSPEIATCLYTALMTDTGSFMFQGTNENTFALARELVLAGADPAHCARGIYFAHSVAKIRLLGEALRNLNRGRPHRLRLGDAEADGTLRRDRRRLRRPGELRSFHRRRRGGGVLPRVARRAIPRQPAQQGQTRRGARGRELRRRRPRMRQRMLASTGRSPKRCARFFSSFAADLPYNRRSIADFRFLIAD